MTKAVIGIIGGSRIYDLPGLTRLREKRVETPWGRAEQRAPLREPDR